MPRHKSLKNDFSIHRSPVFIFATPENVFNFLFNNIIFIYNNLEFIFFLLDEKETPVGIPSGKESRKSDPNPDEMSGPIPDTADFRADALL